MNLLTKSLDSQLVFPAIIQVASFVSSFVSSGDTLSVRKQRKTKERIMKRQPRRNGEETKDETKARGEGANKPCAQQHLGMWEGKEREEGEEEEGEEEDVCNGQRQ